MIFTISKKLMHYTLFYQNTILLYTYLGSIPNNLKSQRFRLQFEINVLPEREQVRAAEVQFTMIYKKELKYEESIQVLIHDIVKPGIKGLSKPILRYYTNFVLNMSY